MRAAPLEFRYRLLLLSVIVALGFWSPGLRTATVWMLASGWLAHRQWLSIQSASLLVGESAAVLALLAALLRTWAAAYIGSDVIRSPDIHTHACVAAGPFRYMRNPLYLGVLLHFVAIAIFMPAYGAIFTVVATTLLLLRLIVGEESRLAATPGYAAYAARVPRLLPALSPRVPPSSARPRWPQAFAGEFYCWMAFVVFAVLVPQFSATLVLQGILVSLGLSLVLKGLLPTRKAASAAA